MQKCAERQLPTSEFVEEFSDKDLGCGLGELAASVSVSDILWDTRLLIVVDLLILLTSC